MSHGADLENGFRLPDAFRDVSQVLLRVPECAAGATSAKSFPFQSLFRSGRVNPPTLPPGLVEQNGTVSVRCAAHSEQTESANNPCNVPDVCDRHSSGSWAILRKCNERAMEIVRFAGTRRRLKIEVPASAT